MTWPVFACLGLRGGKLAFRYLVGFTHQFMAGRCEVHGMLLVVCRGGCVGASDATLASGKNRTDHVAKPKSMNRTGVSHSKMIDSPVFRNWPLTLIVWKPKVSNAALVLTSDTFDICGPIPLTRTLLKRQPTAFEVLIS